MNPTAANPEEVHRFWFADTLVYPRAAEERNTVWFDASPDFDAEVRTRFESIIDAAARGELSDWENAPRSCAALVVVLDQFPRNAYRRTAAAFAHDALALRTTKHAVDARHLDALSVPERAFLLMPYQHIEDVSVQREGLRLFEGMEEDAEPQWRAFAGNVLRYARAHLEIVERFGRFPHRNAILGRPSTAVEIEYLESNSNAFGQGGAR